MGGVVLLVVCEGSCMLQLSVYMSRRFWKRSKHEQVNGKAYEDKAEHRES